MKNRKIVVAAIGGNILSDGTTSVSHQMARAKGAARLIKTLVQRDFNVVVVHGNGPQVGMSYLRQLSGAKENIPPLNLALCDALTQAEIGTMLELAMINEMNPEMPDFDVLTIVTQVEVRGDDPAFQHPTKPIGPFYGKREYANIQQQFPDWKFVEDSGRGYRRVVPSPHPVHVFSIGAIRHAFEAAQVVITGGGGGIPVVRKPDHTFELIDGVIDKDRTACRLALELGASHFLILTGVDHVRLNFRQPDEKSLFDLSVEDAKRYIAEGHFPPGSMGPKMETAVAFAEQTGGLAIITDSDHMASALDGKQGTRIHR